MSTDYLPALVSPRLLPGYDGFAILMGATGMYWRLVAQAGIQPGSTVLEIGCGTGNVVLRAKRAVPGATVIGLDPDGEALGIARRKAADEGLALQLDEGVAEDLPYDDGSVDRVLSSLMLHHLPADRQVSALREVRRVLAPGGSLHLVDLDADPRVAGPMRPVNRVLSLLHRLDPAARRLGFGGGHGRGPGARSRSRWGPAGSGGAGRGRIRRAGRRRARQHTDGCGDLPPRGSLTPTTHPLPCRAEAWQSGRMHPP
ncbi:putative methyltransferase [Pseudonocardia sp. Ae168_Ps1]|uniref:class I SAM-dependent methyltransferase n=1 Tax=unclassified Pseudonocardia TaxID=2619320 RepID=UPI00094B23AE|nr:MULTISPECIES: class I SAM-dependent methyltransferase [unclassified Pseudonocardia]OLL76416.1 putative methyltransferase [Pseudonocardia sp. Ae150A_Ps1]OLL82426.1 putative methyltransferase [Pseudonocardia sp. Ae168_Ps1]OLL83459.1 putative methyltransferase [Pseudonocardia sp. Ae263_Ps1]OLL90501.1 putative methyltransferase [Pseudonocardia sp. Ae356_Ps1]